MKRRTEGSEELSGFLDEGTQVKGELSFQEMLRIDGKFEGAIRSGQRLVIGESADVNADIQVDAISIRGRLRGSVRAKERVELLSTARCECRIETKTLVVIEGATFEGECTMETAKAMPREVKLGTVKQFSSPE